MKQPTTIPAAPKVRKTRAKKIPADTASAPPSETLLHVDLWTDSTSEPFQPLAVQMVTDLILSTSGNLQSSSETAISASYRSTRQAIAAVRNLCLLVNGFSSTSNAPIHAAFTLCHATDLEHISKSPKQPQRVLLVGSICDTARAIPGLRFRELPSTGKTPHCTTLELLTPPHHDLSSRPKAAYFAAAVERSEHPPFAHPTSELSSRPESAPLADVAERPASLPATAPNPKRRMQLFAAAGAAALIAIIALVFISRPSTKSHPAPTPIAAGVPPASVRQPAPAPPAVTAPKPNPVAEPHKQPPPPPKTKQTPSPSPQHETAPPRSSSGVTFSPDEIKHMVATADKLSGDGNYDRAITLYDAVLKVDHRNGPALAGRQRAIYNRDHR